MNAQSSDQSTEKHKAGAMRRLAAQFPPPWSVPPPMDRFEFADRDLAGLFDLSTRTHGLPVLRVLQLERERVFAHIEAIEDLSYYARPSFIVGEWVTWGPDGPGLAGSTYSPSGHDRALAYHRLWWVDVLLLVHVNDKEAV